MRKMILLFIIVLSSCVNDDDGTSSPLPELTFEGKNTFGCTIDGVNFLPRESGFNLNDPIPELTSQYVFINLDAPNGYWFSIFADNEVLSQSITIERILSDMPLTERVYTFGNQEHGVLNADYQTIGDLVTNEYGNDFRRWTNYATTNQTAGELNIIKLDQDKQILSGTFWFDCVDPEGNTVKIRNGRFDVKYKNYY